MPILAVPFIAGVVGFGAGFFAGDTAGKIAKYAVIGAGGYITYKLVKEHVK